MVMLVNNAGDMVMDFVFAQPLGEGNCWSASRQAPDP